MLSYDGNCKGTMDKTCMVTYNTTDGFMEIAWKGDFMTDTWHVEGLLVLCMSGNDITAQFDIKFKI